MFSKLTVKLVTLRCSLPRRVSFLYPSRHLEFQISLSFQDLITNDTSREQTKTQVWKR